MCIIFSRRNIKPHQLYVNLFSGTKFWKNLSKYKYLILKRSFIVYYHVLLIYIVIFRIPSLLHLEFAISVKQINIIMIGMTIFGFLGTNFILLLSKWFRLINLMIFLFVFVTFIALVWTFYDLDITLGLYIQSLYVIAFFYGCFLRATPMFFSDIEDFDQRNQLNCRYISYMLAYTIWGPIAIFILDCGHLYRHLPNDNSTTALCAISSLIGLFAIMSYGKIYISKQ